MYVQINKKLYTVHRLVAEAFLTNPDKLPTVDHIDRCKSNNSVSNLRWADHYTQHRNTEAYDISEIKYGVHWCEDKAAYMHAWYLAHKGGV